MTLHVICSHVNKIKMKMKLVLCLGELFCWWSLLAAGLWQRVNPTLENGVRQQMSFLNSKWKINEWPMSWEGGINVHVISSTCKKNMKLGLLRGGFLLKAIASRRILHPTDGRIRVSILDPTLKKWSETAKWNFLSTGCLENWTSATVGLVLAVFALFPWV